jgi:hypothetical protein
MQASEVPRAVAAAMSIASSLDLTVDDAIVLQNSNRLTLRVLPCDVLARVAPVAHQVAQFEVELAQRLAESGCPVAALEPRVEPRVYERDGFVVTLWTYYEPATPRVVSPAGYATALERLHAGMRKLDVPAPHFTDRVDQAQQLVASRDHTPASRTRATCSPRRTGCFHRSRDVLPWTCRVRPGPCARSSQRALSGCQLSLAARVPNPRAGDDRNVALAKRRPTPKRASAGHRVAQPDSSSSQVRRAR